MKVVETYKRDFAELFLAIEQNNEVAHYELWLNSNLIGIYHNDLDASDAFKGITAAMNDAYCAGKRDKKG